MARVSVFCLLALVACSPLESDDRRARQALAELSATGYQAPLDEGARLEVPPGRAEGMAVTAVPLERGRLVASGRISVEGRAGGTPFSYLGDERFLVVCTGPCKVEGSPAPQLEEVLGRLLERRQALERGDAEALKALSTVGGSREIEGGDVAAAGARGARAWFIRVDRNVAIVGEAGGDGQQWKMTLEKEGDEWRFASGLP